MNYKTCTVEELADHVAASTVAAITQQIMYYKKKDNAEIVAKIKKARLLAKQRKILKEMEEI
jgi:hypothetical protein